MRDRDNRRYYRSSRYDDDRYYDDRRSYNGHTNNSSSSRSRKRNHYSSSQSHYRGRSRSPVMKRRAYDAVDRRRKDRRSSPPPSQPQATRSPNEIAEQQQQRQVHFNDDDFEEGVIDEEEGVIDEDEEYRKRVEEQLAALEQEEEYNSKEAELQREREHRAALMEKLNRVESKPESPPIQNESPPKDENIDCVVQSTDIPPAAAPVADTNTEFDMFADSPSNLIELDDAHADAKATTLVTADAYDDPDGYYIFRRGDVLHNRYVVYAKQGEGVFSTVLRVHDREDGDKELVVKVVRSQETMYKAGVKELQYLRLLQTKDSEARKYIVHVHAHFEHRGHLCLVFEPLYKNMRQIIRKFGNIGLHISAVRRFARHMLIALKHLKKCGLLHADIKLDNILVDESMTTAKLCDFGSAGLLTEREITPYLVSRFYRAPEIILGLEYDYKLDMWSVGCVLFELYTGKIMFQGDDNNHMLLLHQELKGAFPAKMIKRGTFSSRHFDMADYTFKYVHVDRHSRQQLVEKKKIVKATRSLRQDILKHSNDNDRADALELVDLLDKCLQLNPQKRIGVEMALCHQFVTPTSTKQAANNNPNASTTTMLPRSAMSLIKGIVPVDKRTMQL